MATKTQFITQQEECCIFYNVVTGVAPFGNEVFLQECVLPNYFQKRPPNECAWMSMLQQLLGWPAANHFMRDSPLQNIWLPRMDTHTPATNHVCCYRLESSWRNPLPPMTQLQKGNSQSPLSHLHYVRVIEPWPVAAVVQL